MLKAILSSARAAQNYLRLPALAREELHRDRSGRLYPDPGIDTAVDAAIDWICTAQDHSASQDGGVARDFSLVTGWNTSYPETTGYIVPTMIAVAGLRDRQDLELRARRMLDWLVGIQLEGGGFQGGVINQEPKVPVTFNTGQILLGLAAGAAHFGDHYLPPMTAAADWLVESQHVTGCWRRNPSPFTSPGLKVYETHVAWGLLEAARVTPGKGYAEAALRNIEWALIHQHENGWFDHCCLITPEHPLTHTIGYVLRGVLEGHRYSGDPALLEAGRRTAEQLLHTLHPNGYLPGRFDRNWRGTVPWACLTGSVQIAHCWLYLYQQTGDPRFRDAGFAANHYVRRTMRLDGPAEIRGAIKGSFPVFGGYGTYRYLNWAAKFLIDSSLLEQEIRQAEGLLETGGRAA